jgi:cobalt-precorrin-5B (C1)-methyltransferase
LARKGLKTGFSTGAAAAAGAKAALLSLIQGTPPEKVRLDLPEGHQLWVTVKEVLVLDSQKAQATVVKQAGDDPDVTNHAEILTQVEIGPGSEPGAQIEITGGSGVGRVTLPGLALAVGEPAINPGPRAIITKAVTQAWSEGPDLNLPVKIKVLISVPKGGELAQYTLNPRLGIKGGISILGTTGLVRPFSHEAYTATIESACQVARAQGVDEVVFTTGGKSEKLAMQTRPDLPALAFVQIADFFGFALKTAAKSGFSRVGLVCFFGKAVKQAQGLEYTHAHKAPMDLAWLGERLAEKGVTRDLVSKVSRANTARHGLDILRKKNRLDLVELVGEMALKKARGFLGPCPELWYRIIDFDQSRLYEGKDLPRA